MTRARTTTGIAAGLVLALVLGMPAPPAGAQPQELDRNGATASDDGEDAAPDPGEPSRSLLMQRLEAMHLAVEAADAEALWTLMDEHSREQIRQLHATLKQRVERLSEAQRERTPAGWDETDALGDVLAMDATEFLALFLRSREGRDAAQRLGRVEEVTRLLHPDRDQFWVVRLIDYARREARRRVQGPQADEGRVVHFTLAGENLGQPPTTAVYEDGRWRLRLFPGGSE